MAITRSRVREILDELWDEVVVPINVSDEKREEWFEAFAAAEEAILSMR